MADLSLQDYGTVQVPNMLDIMTKQAQADKYSLDVAKESRNFNALRQYGDAAARGDNEAKIKLQSQFPEAAEIYGRIDQGAAATAQQRFETQKQKQAALAAQLSEMSDPGQKMAYGMDFIDQQVQNREMHPQIAQHLKDQLKNDPRVLDSWIAANIPSGDLPGIYGRKKRIDESMKPPVQVPVPGAGPGGFVQRNVPPQNLPGAWTPGSDSRGPPAFPGPLTTPAAPGVTGPGPYTPGSINAEPLPPLVPRRISGPGPRSDAGDSEIPEGGTPSSPVGQRIKSEVANYPNINNELAQVTADIESKHGTVADRPGSQYRGVFQLGQAERDRWGGSGIPQGIQSLSARKDELAGILGREPENWEVHLAHQQGSAGAAKMIQNPDTPAGQLTNPQYIANNGGNPNAPASEFVDKWKQQYETRAARYRGAAPPPSAAAPAAAPAAQVQPVAAAAPGAATATEAPAATPAASAAAPAATAPPSAAARAPGAGFGLYVGDSITAQQIRHGGTGTEDAPNSGQPIKAGLTAGVGDGPNRVLARINTLDNVPETVFLSTGATNRPNEVNAVDDQITQLGKKGAKYVVVPGVGPGVANADTVNAILKDTVEKPRDGIQGVYFDPQVKWISNKNESGIHPAQVDKVREQALKALENARASSTLTNEQRQGSLENPTPEEAAGGPPDTVEGQTTGSPGVQLVADKPPDEIVPTTRARQPFGTPPSAEATPIAGATPMSGAAPIGTTPYVDIPGSYAAPHPLIMKDIEKNQDETRTEFAEVTKVARDANAGLGAIAKLDAILDGGYVTGMSAGVREEVSNILSTTANIFGKTSSITDRQAAMYNLFNSISKQLAFDMVTALGSREAQQIVAQVMDIKPSVFHTVAGNRAINESLRQVFQMSIDKSNFYEKWIGDQSNYGKLGVSDAFFKTHPVEIYASKVTPLAIPKEDGKIQYDQMVPGAYYDIGGKGGHKQGTRGLWDGENPTEAGIPKHMRATGVK